jgi:hypothetical protein
VTAPAPSLGPRESRVLRLVADYQLTEGTPPRIDDVLLWLSEYPALARDAVELLVGRRYIKRQPGSPLLWLTFRGLRSSGAPLQGKVSLIAEHLLSYVKSRARREGSRFVTYTWQDLTHAGVVVDEDFAPALAAIRILRLSGGSDMWSEGPDSARSGTWSAPHDLVELLAVNDIIGIYARAERLALLESPLEEEGTVLRISRSRLLDLQESLYIADKTRRLDGVANIVQEIMGALAPGETQDLIRACQENLGRADLSDHSRSASLHALARMCHHLHRTAAFEPSPAVEADSYIKFLEAALREGRDLGLGKTISLAAIGKRARLDAATLHAAAARSVDEDLTYFSDIDEQLYSIQIDDEGDVSKLIFEIKGDHLRASASRSLPTVVNHFHGNVGAVAAAHAATAHGTVVTHSAQQVDEAMTRVIQHQDELGAVADLLLRLLRAARRLEAERLPQRTFAETIERTEEFRAFQEALRVGLSQASAAAVASTLEVVPDLKSALLRGGAG